MSQYEYVETSIWSDPAFEALGPHSKLVYLWSFTNPRCNLMGIYKTSSKQISRETGISPKRVEEALGELEEIRLLYFDGTYIFVRARVKYLQHHNQRTAKSIKRELKKADQSHPYVQSFMFLYQHQDWLADAFEGFDCPDVPAEPVVYPIRASA